MNFCMMGKGFVHFTKEQAMHNVRVREYRQEDFRGIVYFSGMPCAKRAEKLALVAHTNFSCYVAQTNEVVGFALLEHMDNNCHALLEISASPRRKGIGTRLLARMIDQLGYGSRMYADVGVHNHAAIRFFEAMQFHTEHIDGQSSEGESVRRYSINI